MTPQRKRIVVLYNVDYTPGAVDYEARADVEKTAHAVAAAVDASDELVAELIPVEGRSFAFVDKLQRLAPAAVFNLCESLDGMASHEALIPAVLDYLRIPYTGSGVLTLAVALQKNRTKELLLARGIATPRAIAVTAPPRVAPDFGFPCIVKPNSEDGSLGITAKSVVYDLKSLKRQVKEVHGLYQASVLIEQYIEGREIIVPLLQSESGFEQVPMSELDFSDMPKDLPRILTYRGKWETGSDEYRGSVPRPNPVLKPALKQAISSAAIAAFAALGARGYARVDLRVSKGGKPYVIDFNPNCDLSPGGGFFKACKAAGMSYSDMVLKLIAVCLSH